MRAVSTITTTARVALRTAVLAATLVCASNGAYATGVASVIINGLFVEGLAAPGSFLFAPSNTRSQSWDLQALHNNVPIQQSSGSVANWNNLDRTAQAPQARTTLSSAVDTAGSLETPRFSLTATASHSPSVLNTALGNMLTEGSFCFWDSSTAFDGTSASCTGSGSLALTLFYDLIVGAGVGDSAYAEIDLFGDGVPGGLFFDFAGTGLGIPSRLDQFFSWTADLTAGNAASFSLAGTVVAEAVPEPGVLSLLALGLIGLAATRRRHTRASS